jgi:hypothetical protein
MTYKNFIDSKSQLDGDFGFDPIEMTTELFGFQHHLTTWAIQKGRAAIFADCGMGKTLIELAWADNVYRHTGKPVLVLTPLAVGQQFVREGDKFGFEVSRSRDGKAESPIVITNYEQLAKFDSAQFGGVVCDESSILKNFNGIRKSEITEFMRLHKFRLLGTATAAPNDYTELGTSSEALGYLGYMDMLGRFFTNKQQNSHGMNGLWRDNDAKFRFKGHAEKKFWRWVSSWARALRRPSDMGFDDNGFILPELIINRHSIKPNTPPPGMLFALPAVGLQEQRKERSRTFTERCEMAAQLVDGNHTAVIWCHLNKEGDLLEKLIPGAAQVSGKDSDDQKEAKFEAFSSGELKVLITKPKIGAWGLNWQHCNHTVYFPSHSYEQYYQAVRRFYRFGQEKPVTVDVVGTAGEINIMNNLQRKEEAAVKMFDALVAHMNGSLSIERRHKYENDMEIPSWL